MKICHLEEEGHLKFSCRKLGCYPFCFLSVITSPIPAFNPCRFQEFSFQTAPKPIYPCHHLLAGKGTGTLGAKSLGQNPVPASYQLSDLVQGDFVRQLQTTACLPPCVIFKASVLPSGAPPGILFYQLEHTNTLTT